MRGSAALARKADTANERAAGACTRGRAARGASERSADRKSITERLPGGAEAGGREGPDGESVASLCVCARAQSLRALTATAVQIGNRGRGRSAAETRVGDRFDVRADANGDGSDTGARGTGAVDQAGHAVSQLLPSLARHLPGSGAGSRTRSCRRQRISGRPPRAPAAPASRESLFSAAIPYMPGVHARDRSCKSPI